MTCLCRVAAGGLIVVGAMFGRVTVAAAADPPPRTDPRAVAEESPEATDDATAQVKDKEKAPPGLTRLSKSDDVWIDPMRKLVIVDGRVCLRQGVLELFACPRGGKQHESIVAVSSKPFVIHAGLLAIGAEPGRPVQFDPEYKPATGMKIDIWVLWKDEKGMRRKVRAQEWIREASTGKPMQQDWIFAGSSMYKDEETGKEAYRADITGDLICVSNFATATLDLPIKSSADNVDLLFEPFTERIPPIGTQVRLVLAPRFEKKSPPAADDKDKPKPDGAAE